MPKGLQSIVSAIMKGGDIPRFSWSFVNGELKFIKCVQGHSGEHSTLEPEDKYRLRTGDVRYLYHGTTDHVVPLIRKEGVLPNIRGRPQTYWSPLPMDQKC